MNNPKEQLGEQLFMIVGQGLAERLRSGEASYQDYKNAIDFLKNNGITAEPRRGTPLGIIKEQVVDDKVLPFVPKKQAQ